MTNEKLSELIGIQNRINALKAILIVLDSSGVTIGFLPDLEADGCFAKYLIPEKEMVEVIKDYFEKELSRLTKEFEEA